MINAWEYAYDNYDGENEDAIVDSIVEQIMDEIYDACDVNEEIYNEELHSRLEEAVRDTVLENLNFNEVKKQIEDNRDEYFEREKARKGEY